MYNNVKWGGEGWGGAGWAGEGWGVRRGTGYSTISEKVTEL